MSRCLLWHNPVPLGWGDHVRWMHETENWSRSAGVRHAEARRGANDMRRRAWRRECERIPRKFTAYDVYTGQGDHPAIRDLYARSERFAPGYGVR